MTLASDLVLTRHADRTLIHVGDLELAEFDAVSPPAQLMLDVAAARELGFKRPRKVRELIARIWPDPAARPYLHTPPGGAAAEYWLTHAELVRLVSRCRTPEAAAQADRLIERFGAAMAARREAPQSGAAGETSSERGLVVTAPQHGAGGAPIAAPGTLAADPRWPRVESLLRGVRPRLADATIARVGASALGPMPRDLSWPFVQGLARLYQRALDVSERDDLP